MSLGLRPRPRFLLVFGGFAAKNQQKKIFRGWQSHPQTPAGGDFATALLTFWR